MGSDAHSSSQRFRPVRVGLQQVVSRFIRRLAINPFLREQADGFTNVSSEDVRVAPSIQ